jgi:hypothetical protein
LIDYADSKRTTYFAKRDYADNERTTYFAKRDALNSSTRKSLKEEESSNLKHVLYISDKSGIRLVAVDRDSLKHKGTRPSNSGYCTQDIYT